MPIIVRFIKIKKIISLNLIFIALVNSIYAQDFNKSDSTTLISKLFQNTQMLALKLNYSKRAIKYNTNDSTYISSNLSFKTEYGFWKTIEVNLRARGNFRRKNCDNTPLKLQIDPQISEGTLFEGNKKLKLVLPCFNYSGSNDYVIKEYLAYKLYEQLAPYHFKTRLVSIDYTEIVGKKMKSRQFIGFFIEDIKNVANRHNGNVFKRHMRPQAQDELSSVQNALFQFMIANTDFSTTFQHNQKQLWADEKMRPIPYDFDMSGFVNTNYALVSKVQNGVLPINEVTERYYMGYQRNETIFETVRISFISNKEKIFNYLDSHESLFERKMEFVKARDFISSFYKIIENDKKFKRDVVGIARPMVLRKLKAK